MVSMRDLVYLLLLQTLTLLSLFKQTQRVHAASLLHQPPLLLSVNHTDEEKKIKSRHVSVVGLNLL